MVHDVGVRSDLMTIELSLGMRQRPIRPGCSKPTLMRARCLIRIEKLFLRKGPRDIEWHLIAHITY
jgi:hypothetical protein